MRKETMSDIIDPSKAPAPEPEPEDFTIKRTTVVEIKRYLDPAGRAIEVHVPVDGSPPQFIGNGHAVLQAPGNPGNINVNYVFPISAGDIKEAYALYDAANVAFQPTLKKNVQKQMAEAARKHQQQIQTATRVPPPMFPPRR